MNDSEISFSERVYTIVAQIPCGKVATYGDIAKRSGNVKAARAVGMCMNKNRDTYRVPCHRVVASTGELTGYAFGGVEAKRKKLLEEGIVFVGDRVDLKKSEWK
ncbi:MAG: MGMT family protein [Candidatus Uhrbacteria bacterium]|nr:MGMT family protein [Candidatus Uhrbacteria bacterium]